MAFPAFLYSYVFATRNPSSYCRASQTLGREDSYSSKFFKQAFENFLARFFNGLPQIFDRRC